MSDEPTVDWLRSVIGRSPERTDLEALFGIKGDPPAPEPEPQPTEEPPVTELDDNARTNIVTAAGLPAHMAPHIAGTTAEEVQTNAANVARIVGDRVAEASMGERRPDRSLGRTPMPAPDDPSELMSSMMRDRASRWIN